MSYVDWNVLMRTSPVINGHSVFHQKRIMLYYCHVLQISFLQAHWIFAWLHIFIIISFAIQFLTWWAIIIIIYLHKCRLYLYSIQLYCVNIWRFTIIGIYTTRPLELEGAKLQSGSLAPSNSKGTNCQLHVCVVYFGRIHIVPVYFVFVF